MLSRILIGIATAAVIMTASCSGSHDNTSQSDDMTFETSDLSLFELSHRVRNVTTTTYYVTRRDERVRRDEEGRIIRWEDRRPNLRRLHGGFLKDTLSYRHVSPNIVQTSGMGDYAITVYDDNHRIVGQYTDPLADGDKTAVFNVYRAEDSHGNWTERLSIWTTQTPGQRPHISYSLDRREIVYY